MKRLIESGGKITHELTQTEQKAILKVMVIVDEAVFIHRGTNEGIALAALLDHLQVVHDGETLTADPDGE